MEQNNQQSPSDDPLEIEVFYPKTVELIDPTGGFPPHTVNQEGWHRQPKNRKKLALFLFLATCVSTLLAGGLKLFEIQDQIHFQFNFWEGLQYALPVMSILLAHEMGHYLQARRYGVPASLPYFIPMPFSPFGTMGAVIVQGGGADRKQMFDIAITGPLAGLILALPITYFGLVNAEIIPIIPNGGGLIFGDPLILQWMNEWINGPLGEHQAIGLNPMLFAGWVGIFITALNLVPIGQLDGGHILYTLIGKRAHVVATLLLWGAVGFMVYHRSMNYMLLVILLFIFGAKHPPTANDHVPLGRFRVILGWLTLGFIIIGFTPTPIILPEEQKPAPQKQKIEQSPGELARTEEKSFPSTVRSTKNDRTKPVVHSVSIVNPQSTILLTLPNSTS